MVQDDFELICWDVVSSPSTPGSYLYKDQNDFKKYDEVLDNTNDITENKSEDDKESDFMNNLNKFLGM